MIQKITPQVIEWKDGKPWIQSGLTEEEKKINELVEAFNLLSPQNEKELPPMYYGDEKHPNLESIYKAHPELKACPEKENGRIIKITEEGFWEECGRDARNFMRVKEELKCICGGRGARGEHGNLQCPQYGNNDGLSTVGTEAKDREVFNITIGKEEPSNLGSGGMKEKNGSNHIMILEKPKQIDVDGMIEEVYDLGMNERMAAMSEKVGDAEYSRICNEGLERKRQIKKQLKQALQQQ